MIIQFSELKKFRQNIESEKKLVFTNGCFDILHKGHISYLKEAKSLGDYLIVAINSDDSVRKLKGENRPINNENDRAFLVDNLKPVDFVTIFSEDTPYNVIGELLPDFLVKGGDWHEDQIVGSDIVKNNGGKVVSLHFVNDYSTTNVLKKMISPKSPKNM